MASLSRHKARISESLNYSARSQLRAGLLVGPGLCLTMSQTPVQTPDYRPNTTINETLIRSELSNKDQRS